MEVELNAVDNGGLANVPFADARKIVIFYSSIGFGHFSAAQAIAEEILRMDGGVQVTLQDIRAFMNPAWRLIDERLYWFVATHLPDSFETLFRSTQARGNRVSSLSLLPNDYPEEKVLAYLEQLAPDAALATHYGAAQVLGTLRERGQLAGVRLGWLHTDFFEGYFPRISKRIDRTFLAHAELESRWVAAGVPADKVVTTGMPVQVPVDDPDSRRRTLSALGLNPATPTLLLAGGKEGKGDYPGVIDSIECHCRGELQILAVCGTNAKRKGELDNRVEHMPRNIRLKVFGLIRHDDMLDYLRAADVLITKAGGLSPSEAFTLGIPTILLDVVSGHERENAATFVRLGLAELAEATDRVGVIAAEILSDSRKREAMLDAQRDYRRHVEIARIAEFALDDAFAPAPLPADYGAENGSPVVDIDEALRQIEAERPADVELLLSYATAKSPQRVVIENPFGHIAIRVDDTVFSANYIADRKTDPNFLQHLHLADYLYGVQQPSASQVHTNTYGMAYGRETIGLRVAGIAADRKAAMVEEAHRIEEQFRQGLMHWDRSGFNCADVVARILQAGGFGDPGLIDRLGLLPTMPLDTFEAAQAAFEMESPAQELELDLVAYRQIPGAQASYRFSRFPLSLGQPLRSMVKILRDAPSDPLETAVTRQIAAYFGDRRLQVEELRTPTFDADGNEQGYRLELALLKDLKRLASLFAALPLLELGRLEVLPVTREISLLIEHAQQRSMRALENAEAMALSPLSPRLRTLFTELLAAYERLGGQELNAAQVLAYLKRLKAFIAEATKQFSHLSALADVATRRPPRR